VGHRVIERRKYSLRIPNIQVELQSIKEEELEVSVENTKEPLKIKTENDDLAGSSSVSSSPNLGTSGTLGPCFFLLVICFTRFWTSS
jgi:hypothetical protein